LVVERIIHGMTHLDLDRDHPLLTVDSLQNVFQNRTEDIIKLLDKKLVEVVKEEKEDKDNGI
jgi:hypothetical protein